MQVLIILNYNISFNSFYLLKENLRTLYLMFKLQMNKVYTLIFSTLLASNWYGWLPEISFRRIGPDFCMWKWVFGTMFTKWPFQFNNRIKVIFIGTNLTNQDSPRFFWYLGQKLLFKIQIFVAVFSQSI